MADARGQEKRCVQPSPSGLSNERDERPNLPHITKEEEDFESSALSNEERLLAFADLYGRKAPHELDSDRHLEAFDREMRHLPAKQKRALLQGYSVKQARLFLDIECNDARRAVERMARYWDERFERFGKEAFLDRGKIPRTKEDFRRVYNMALKALTDPEVDEETMYWAKKFVGEWNRAFIGELDQELSSIPANEKTALVEAMSQRPDVAASEEHKLLFLRSEDFDAIRAAQRMVKYWTLKFDLFGIEEAFCPITVNDLMKKHPLELSLGFLWNIEGTDASGRALVFLAPGDAYARVMKEQGYTEDGVLKLIWYMVHALLGEKKSSLDNGVVLLIDERNTKFFNVKLASRCSAVWYHSLPVNIKAIHAFPPPHYYFINSFLRVLKWVVGKRLRMRLWVHTGTEEENLSELEECGIPRDAIPTTLGGNLDIDCAGKAWLEERRRGGL